jgi:hypothetical protein
MNGMNKIMKIHGRKKRERKRECEGGRKERREGEKRGRGRKKRK